MTVLDADVNFYIAVKLKDLLVFVSKEYELKRVLLEKKLLDKAIYYGVVRPISRTIRRSCGYKNAFH